MALRPDPRRFLAAIVIGFVAVIGGGFVLALLESGRAPVVPRTPHAAALATFASCDELQERIARFTKERSGFYEASGRSVGVPTAAAPQEAFGIGGAPDASDYTRTNVQVEGVDEADIVKTDGSFLYLLEQGKLRIVRATPATSAALLATVSFGNDTPQELFLHGNFVAVFGQRALQPITEPYPVPLIPDTPVQESPLIYPWYSSETFIDVYDVSNRSEPKLSRSLEFRGNYLSSRLIDGTVYAVLNSTPEVQILDSPDGNEAKVKAPDESRLVPQLRQAQGVIPANEPFTPVVPCSAVAYPRVVLDSQYLTILGFPIDQPTAEPSRAVILGTGSTVYASPKNLYIAGIDYGYDRIVPRPLGIVGLVPEFPTEETIVHAFALNREAITYRGEGRVPGHFLNQFSMDEYNNYFRIATTQNEQWFGAEEGREAQSKNGVYVLDGDLKRTGAVEDIAPGETIYSARFMGERAYLVTFKKIDPFFVLDLADPMNPRVLGKLKIPGYSDYLHPYDATHIIGIGKNAEDAPESGFAWYQGIKLALFDATDPENPRELHKVDIGDRGTDSPALQNHKAFLFDPSRNLLVLPIMLAEINDAQQSPEFEESFLRGSQYSNFVFQGSYVFELALDKGFVLKGRVTHLDDAVAYFRRTGYYPGESDLFISRNIRIGDNLYSLSNGKVVANALSDLRKIAEVRLAN